ncbi:MAG: hypothetical protein HYS57_00330, partial [Parcubacteria group bacterium]|nr:hypothetical protein [Parcubacteria group bacterium]
FFLTRVPEGIALITKRNPPKPEIAVSHQKNLDGTIDVKLRMINRGGTTFSSNRLWPGLNSGMHVEVCGADIVRSDPYSPTAEYAWRYQSVYSFARWGDCYFTEIKFRQLRKNQWGEAVFTIKPWTTDKPSLYYRAWMTETSCIIDYKKSSGETPEEQKLLESEGEPCIVRSPTNKDTSQPLCPVQVMAARMGLQDFRCGSSILAQ